MNYIVGMQLPHGNEETDKKINNFILTFQKITDNSKTRYAKEQGCEKDDLWVIK